MKYLHRYLEKIATIIRDLSQAAHNLISHDGIEHAGYIAFIAIIAMIPFAVLITATMSLLSYKYLFMHEENPVEMLNQLLNNSAMRTFLEGIMPRLQEIGATPPSSFLTITILSGIWSASSIFEGLRTILNRAYRVKDTPDYLKRRAISIMEFFVILSITVIFLFMIKIFPYCFSILHKFLRIITNDAEILASLNDMLATIKSTEKIRALITEIFLFLVITSLYYFLPNQKITFSRHMPGSALALILMHIFSKIFFHYIKTFPQIHLIYGSIAGLVITLMFFYCCALLIILGAEFNYEIIRNINDAKNK